MYKEPNTANNHLLRWLASLLITWRSWVRNSLAVWCPFLHPLVVPFLAPDGGTLSCIRWGYVMMPVSKKTVMAIKSYQSQAEVLVRNYLLADPVIPYTSVLSGVFACKMAYDLTQLISSFYFKTYASLTKIQRIEWNNRGISTLHAIFITVMSLYLVFFSDLYSDRRLAGLVTFRSSPLSNFALGVSVGYFVSDLAMIFWLYPALGGMEYVLHHLLSLIAVAYSLVSGEGQLYTYMVLISETTTPGINLRWYLDTAGMKRSTAYLINGVVIFLTWLVARVLLFVYLFYHVYLHYHQVEKMHTFGLLLVFVVPSVLATMNLIWFGKILKGLKKTLAKRQ
ncbi:TRAM/LAG1/CLN8 homology domain [Macleaya cordata]|uniref:TRAM/LAG1/CLN8 homology domain n=1 Tax=Macleaya cordata TaxID=56857 RepID=A0A200QPJ5_MACCD|nr:TRAM/LAG1/CLN8 homology domain [Macleaya cordata]